MAATSSLRPGMVLAPGDKLRPAPIPGSLLHAKAAHSGAPWRPEYDHETAKDEKRKKKESGKDGLAFHDRSYFDSLQIIPDAITRSTEFPALVAHNLNLLIFVNFEHEIGFDVEAGQRTTLVTVIVEPTGKVATVHPGRPKLESIPLPIAYARDGG